MSNIIDSWKHQWRSKKEDRRDDVAATQEKLDTSELQFSVVFRDEYRSGIALPAEDYRGLALMLETYAQGVGSASNATRNDYLSNMWASFGIATHHLNNPRYTNVSPGEARTADVQYSSNSFIENIIQGVKGAYTSGRPSWSKSFDYDGQGRFHKTSVSVDFDRQKRAFILRIYAAYVGDEVEKELAEALGQERALSSIGVTAKLPDMPDQDLTVPMAERATTKIDMTIVAAMLNVVLEKFARGNHKVTPEMIVTALMQKNEWGEDTSEFRVSIGEGLDLVLKIHGGYRFVWEPGVFGWENQKDTRQASGNVLILPFPTDSHIDKPMMNYENPPKQVKNYWIKIEVKRASDDKYSRLPMHDAVQLARAKAVVEDLEGQLKKLMPVHQEEAAKPSGSN